METILFDTWIKVLDAKMQYEKENSKPIHFDGIVVNAPFITLQTKDGTGDVQIGEMMVIECNDGKRIRGEVWEIRPGEVVMNCSGMPLTFVPHSGLVRLDQWAMKVAIDRQREAVDRIRIGNVANSRLKDVINSPFIATIPTLDNVIDPEIKNRLDESKRNALIKALGSKDILLVEGPPGTGKTHFIAALVCEELRSNPHSHILIASQTHVAIDNALERIQKFDKNIKILRIASNQSTSISESSEIFLINQQLKAWRKEILEKAETGIECWATSNNLNLKDIKIGTIIRQISIVSENINNIREKIKDEENRKVNLQNIKDNFSKNANLVEIDRISDELIDYRSNLDTNKKELENLKKSIISIRPDAKALLEDSPSDQLIWADTLVGTSEVGQLAKRLIKIQGEWFDRLGATKGFVKNLIERSSVVAATCVGLASVEELNDVDFDLCIIDEASKATAMESSVPMARAKRWVLVGDSKQLGPFQEEILSKPELQERFEIGSPEAKESMFQRFQRLLPIENKVKLTEQYRMVAPIRELVSHCFYEDELTGGRTNIDSVLCSCTGRSINWLSTSKLDRRFEQVVGHSRTNSEEASRICNIISSIDNKLVRKKVSDEKKVLILSGYDAQLRLLKSRISQIVRDIKILKIECSTIDQVQGRESDIVVFSLTRSNQESNVGFLKELERVNVAISRARELLYIVGDDRFITRADNSEHLLKVLNHVKQRPDHCYFEELIN